ncbi:MAG: DUF357 domain-containing protein [Candidatus Aenigmarchaeota archaeon]|nr:DUF357 domain-containing protein [Candidatus Aenigmarchaeota archaeon]
MGTEEELVGETKRWLSKIKALKITPKSDKGREHKGNIEAYISDSLHFFDKGDYVRSFEAVVWAWAFLEISKDLGLIEVC